MAKADHADAYKQLPLKKEDELTAVATLQSPEDEKCYGFIPKTQLFGSAAAVLRYNCLSRVIASLACRVLKLPCVGYCGDFAIAAPRILINEALEASTKLNDLLLIILKKKKSEAGRVLEFLWITIHFAISYGEAIASLQLSKSRIQKLVELTENPATKTYTTLAELQKAAEKLRFIQTMIAGRFGRAATRPFYELIAQGGGIPTRAFLNCLRWWGQILPNIAPRMVKTPPEGEEARPVRIYSDATGEGDMAGLVISPGDSEGTPMIFTSKAYRALTGLAAWANKIYVFELFAAVATVFAIRQQLAGRKIIIFVDYEAACAALTTGAARNRCALLLVYTLWSVVAQFDLQIWIERAPSAQNPADLWTWGERRRRQYHPYWPTHPTTKCGP